MNNLQIETTQQLTQLDSDTEWAKGYLSGQQNTVNTIKHVEVRQLTTIQLLELMLSCVGEVESRDNFNPAVNGADMEEIHGMVSYVLGHYEGSKA